MKASSPPNKYSSQAGNERRLFYCCLAITFFNIILWFIASTTNSKYPNSTEGKGALSKLIIIETVIILLGFAFGAIFGLIPSKNLTFKQKFFRTSTLSILILEMALFILIVRSIVLFS